MGNDMKAVSLELLAQFIGSLANESPLSQQLLLLIQP